MRQICSFRTNLGTCHTVTLVASSSSIGCSALGLRSMDLELGALLQGDRKTAYLNVSLCINATIRL